MAVDNTYLGPLWQRPLKHGADLVLYHATKYIGGHSDLIAGAVLGNTALVLRVKTLRTFLGNMASPRTGSMLLRGLEILKIRMEDMQDNAIHITSFLKRHEKVAQIKHLGLLQEGTRNNNIYKQQCSVPEAVVSFYIKSGEKKAFKFLNRIN